MFRKIVLIGSVLFGLLAPAAASEISTCFTPGEDCTQFVVDAIKLGKTEILVQAYNYTSAPIITALGVARAEDKVDVRVILDKSNEQERYRAATSNTASHGIPILIDDKPKIAHNKVIIIDRQHVLTGSFNFTVNAQRSNAENIILIKNDPALAKRYVDNWQKRAGASRPMKPAP